MSMTRLILMTRVTAFFGVVQNCSKMYFDHYLNRCLTTNEQIRSINSKEKIRSRSI